MIIWIASGNEHKRSELAAIFEGCRLQGPDSLGIGDFEPEETGATFLENALIKAREFRRLLLLRGIEGPVLADDSGLCVDALGGRPGIYSARYAGHGKEAAGKKLSAPERNALLLEELGGEPRRSARFVCAMALLWDAHRFAVVEECLEGELVRNLSEAAGEGGFGYDPIFYIPALGRTAAQLDETEKNRLSHRGKAGRQIAKLLAGD